MYNESITTILTTLLTTLQLPFDGIEIQEDEDMTRVLILSSIPSRIIGFHGEILNALQHMVKSIIRSQENLERAPFLVLDVDGYRASQEQKVCQIAEKKADFVRRTGSRIALPPMSPYFRRIVHLFIASNPALQDLTSESTGKGDYRQIVLRLKNEKQAPRSNDSAELQPVIEEDSGDFDDLGNLDL